MLAKLTLPMAALLLLLFVVVVFALTLAVMLVKQIPIPDWLRGAFAPLVTLLIGIVTPTPKAGAS